MKRTIWIIGFLSLTLSVSAKGKDTTFIKRPYFLGLTFGYTQFTHRFESNQFIPPVFLNDLPYSRQMDYGFTPAIQLSFPFLRKMECEAAVQRTTWYGTHPQVSEYHYAASVGHEIVGFRTTRKLFDYSVWQTRVVFSRVISDKNHFMLLAGVGGWLDLQNKEDRNNFGGDVQLKCYLQHEHFGNLQLSVYGGANALDAYAGVRVGYMIKGTRSYRVKPDKYYVRTYED